MSDHQLRVPAPASPIEMPSDVPISEKSAAPSSEVSHSPSYVASLESELAQWRDGRKVNQADWVRMDKEKGGMLQQLEHAGVPGYAMDRDSELAKNLADEEENNPYIHRSVSSRSFVDT